MFARLHKAIFGMPSGDDLAHKALERLERDQVNAQLEMDAAILAMTDKRHAYLRLQEEIDLIDDRIDALRQQLGLPAKDCPPARDAAVLDPDSRNWSEISVLGSCRHD